MKSFTSEGHFQVTQQLDGTFTAAQAIGKQLGIQQRLAEQGFRLPTSDEREYLCGAGAKSLFRWGNHAPCDRYPTDISPAEAQWRIQWVIASGDLEQPPGGFQPDWDWHQKPNAFGLWMSANPYVSELTSDPGIERGGDGGLRMCGGEGFFVAWLALAAAYFEERTCRFDDSRYPISPDNNHCRRVLELT